MTGGETLTLRRIFTADAATLPLPVKAAFGLCVVLAMLLALALSGTLQLHPVEAAVAGDAATEALLAAGGPVTTCSADAAVHSAPYVVTFQTVNMDGPVADVFSSLDGAPFVAGWLVTLQAGTHTLRFYATDGQGTSEPVQSVTITVR